MTDEDEDGQTKGGSPNARRGERRSAPVIEGTAQALKDPLTEADAHEPPHEGEADANGEAARGAGSSPRAPGRRPDAISIVALTIALAALVVAGGIGWRVFNAGPKADQTLQSQIASLRTRVEALDNQKTAIAALDQRVSGLETAVKAASGAAQAASSDANKALATATRASAAPAAPTGPSPAVAALDARIGALERRPDPRALQTEVAAQTAHLTALGQSVASLDQRLGDLNSKLAAVASRLNPLEALLKAPKVDAPALEASNAKAVGQAQASALIVVARSLQGAVASGAPFMAEVAAAQKLGADPALLQKLQPTAATGAPTASALRESFEALAGPILAGVKREHANGLLGRLASGLGKLVSIQTIGSSPGDDPMALVGRIEAALARGDVAAAVAARDRLPASGKALTRSWAARARAHVTATEAAAALLKDAMDRIGKART